jgi:hypothetical protein
MLYYDLKTLNELNIIEEAEKMAVAKVFVLINNFNFPKILLNLIKIEAF